MSKDENKKGPENKSAGGRPDAKGKAAGGAKKPSGKPASKHAEPEADVPAGPKVPPRLKVMFDEQVRAKLGEQFGIKNPMAMPKLQKIVLNVNMGRHLEGTKIPPHVRQQVLDTVTIVSGQKPVVVKARKSVSNFKLRAGFEASVMVTIRRERMWHFLDRLINLATPRIKDFRGLNDKAFDRAGNYSMGLTEQGVFPEINMAEAQFTHGMHINFVFANSTPAKSKFVLEHLGMPFVKKDQK
jgi:large subunit ribosomal protein L5